MLERTFKPNESNNGIPLLLQASGVIALMITAFGVFALAGIHGYVVKNNAGDNYAAVVASVLIDETNDRRIKNGLSDLRPSPILTAAAQMKSNDMATKSYFAHTSPEGLSPWYWFNEAGYKFNYAGENLAVNFRDSSAVTRAWMNSPSHRANIVNGNFSEIGIATSAGNYKGNKTTYVAQHFGAPQPNVSGYDLEELLGREVGGDERASAIKQAENLLAAAGSVTVFDKLMVQPQKIYLVLFAVLLMLVAVVGVNSYYRSDSKVAQEAIIKNTLIIAVSILLLAVASLEMLYSQLIAGVVF